jgi:putative transposase
MLMPTKPRVPVISVPEHIIQRGNKRQVIFAGDGDMKAYVTWFKEYVDTFSVAIDAWVLISFSDLSVERLWFGRGFTE